MPLAVTSIYAALLGLILLYLAGAVGRTRSRVQVSIGPSDREELKIADRRHMNFVETVPFALLLIALVEANGAAKGLVHALGAALVIARVVHPFGISTTRMNHPARGIGAGATFLVILASCFILAWQALVK
jgi:uncharacterized membrane protein YecN with MAPEG domain